MWRHGLSWLVVAASLAGCSQQAQPMPAAGDPPGVPGAVPELVGLARPPIADLPVPLGFSLRESKSRNFTAAGARYIDHVYNGSADKFAVARFYKRQMPISRWTMVTDMFVQGDIMLDFEKDTERCRVTITDGGLFNSTVIKVALWTSGRIVPPTGVRNRKTSTR